MTIILSNENLENYLFYGFVVKEGKLFLNTVYHYTYVNGEKLEHTLFNFNENGEMYIERRNLKTNEIEEREGVVDVTSNWEECPKIGHYSGVIKKER